MGKRVHVLSDVNRTAGTATCASCGPVGLRVKDQGRRVYCVEAAKARARDTYARHGRAPQKLTSEQAWAKNIKYLYGVTVDQYNELLTQQNGVCKLCDKPCASGKKLAVDHCHKTGRIRGLLCTRCNTSLSILEDEFWYPRAKRYLAD